ncbi:hypothetical protein PROFUN_03547 [Planoprotostelium fungivorum]|uniref:Uncharacterized protein n=1 Tax=Planoprotostelium fungivorum TaxID=1890364 RepID=A0A2P6MSF3_9EUKA|nr:hypothetical protein PROFUN_03547 [Planoprotostelium fungivorum]
MKRGRQIDLRTEEEIEWTTSEDFERRSSKRSFWIPSTLLFINSDMHVSDLHEDTRADTEELEGACPEAPDSYATRPPMRSMILSKNDETDSEVYLMSLCFLMQWTQGEDCNCWKCEKRTTSEDNLKRAMNSDPPTEMAVTRLKT